MAVEATYMNLLPSQLLTNREIIKPNNQQQHHLLNSDIYNNTQMDSALPLPTTMPESFLPFYQSTVCDPNKSDSGLTYHIPLQRKRSRDFTTTELTSLPPHQKNKLTPESSFLDQEFLYQFQNQQSEIDRVLAHHTEKVRMEMEEQKMRQSRMLMCAIQEAMAKKLKEKDEEIQRMGKLNFVLQERVKSLCVENQIWKELAHTNETTANYLRTNLEQVLAHVADDHRHAAAAAPAVADDAESSCGSNGSPEAGEDTAGTPVVCGGGDGSRMCKNCGVKESIVLLLPCRHLCLCATCGSTIRNCPVCDSGMDASVHVNLS
ncbi:BOI-related E3 ubiquitin-protein ligase 1-like [Gastrolobium bilobum]|uniref:BOI-related E3 ubiquitin-protein ligase 1-like n=1 Tax=Gastrolobium bilobum TaxID=150636 RepID=UPI002AB1FBCE|nr:BOI-related E3 ubiquitin-protein ligase 1-like [Gastrolobium bilobum]